MGYPCGNLRCYGRNRWVPLVVGLAAVLQLVHVIPALAQGTVREFTSDGAWSWFSDPRAFYRNGLVYAGWVTRNGDIRTGTFCIETGDTAAVTLDPGYEADDHDNPSFIATSDGRFTAFYSRHACGGTFTEYRTSMQPWSIADWSSRSSTERNTPGVGGVTYSNPYLVPGETDRILLFWRGGDWKPTYSYGTYHAAARWWEWTRASTLVATPTGRPYIKYAALGDELIGFAFTTGHPDESDASIYYAAIGKGKDGQCVFLRTDGTLIKPLSAGPLEPWEADVVYTGALSTQDEPTKSWIWDLAFDEEGRPALVFASFPLRTRHRYHWARYDGSAWSDRVLVDDAGGSIADTLIGNPQHYYSGGLALDHADINTVYLCREVEPAGWDLEQWKTDDDGESWSVLPVMTGTYVDNLRPVVPLNRPPETEMVIWMIGRYDYYANDISERSRPQKSDDYNYHTALYVWTNDVSCGVQEAAGSEGSTVRLSCRPNPVTDSAMITFDLLDDSRLNAVIYDISGRRVRTLLHGERKTAGRHTVEWNGRDERGSGVGSGVYFCRVEASADVSSLKLVLLR